MIDSQSQEKLLDDAAAWIARLRSDEHTARDREQFSVWLNQSPEHQQAFDQMQSMWENLSAVKYTPAAKEARNPPQRRRAAWFNSWSVGLATACTAFIFALVFMFQPAQQAPADNELVYQSQRYSTGTGEQRRVVLPDGSTVELNTRTTIEVVYSSAERKVILIEGEAYFAVEKDKARPFLVDIGDGTVMAVGTAFNIRKDADETVVTVTEGKIRVAESPESAEQNSDVKYLSVRQQVRVSALGLSLIKTVRPDKAIAWRGKTVVFDNTPLAEAVAEVARYLEYPIGVDIQDSRLNAVLVSGTFSLQAPDATLDAIVETFNLEKSETESGFILKFME